MDRRVRRWALAVGTGALAFVGWRVVVLAGYRSHARELVEAASRFPREYVVGEGPAMRLVAIGDSTAAGVGVASLEETLPYRVALGMGGRVTVRNLAVSGGRAVDTYGQLIASRGEHFIPSPANADVVLISVSANDVTGGTSPADLQIMLNWTLQRLGDLGAKCVLLSTTPNFRTTPALPLLMNRLFESRAARLTAEIRRVATGFPFVHLADLNGEGTLDGDQYAADGFHPNAAGYRLWASIFLRAMER